MSLKKIVSSSIVIAALLLGAAIPTPAQKKRTNAATRKQTAAQPAAQSSAQSSATANEPAPAKKNARADDQSSSQSSVVSDVSAPAKKNLDARRVEQSSEPAATSSDAKRRADAARGADEARYSYEFTQPDFDVRHVRIEHDAAGRGTITFERKNEEQPLTEPLEISPTAFARIVSAWESLRFLDSDASYQADKHFANLGTIHLTMKRGARERTTEFDWTNNEQAGVLMREYRRLTEQQLFVFDMDVARQYQPSETVRILKRLEILLDRDELSDKSRLTPLLSDLTNDERIPLIARNQAARLLKRIEKETK
jgi:hypothetical protein